MDGIRGQVCVWPRDMLRRRAFSVAIGKAGIKVRVGPAAMIDSAKGSHQRGAHSLRLDIVSSDDSAPLLGVFRNELAKVGRRHQVWNAADTRKLRP